MDNTGNYITYGDVLLELFIAGNVKVKSDSIALSNKQTLVDGDVFDFVAGTSLAPSVGDVIMQAGKTAIIASFPTATQIKLDSTGVIVNGTSTLLHSDSLPQYYVEELIHSAMDMIDESTKQFFNKRDMIIEIEGNNTALMHLQVPIISISKLLINSTKTELIEGEDYDFVAFKGRIRPQDDRRNPRIKLNIGRGRGSIYTGSITSRVFVKGTLTQITGSFGFLEPDGSTPPLIRKAAKLLVMDEINNPIGEGKSSTTGSGPLKRLKVDLHEKEFFEPSSNKANTNSSKTGNNEVDKILTLFRAPMLIGGSIRMLRLSEDDVYRDAQ